MYRGSSGAIVNPAACTFARTGTFQLQRARHPTSARARQTVRSGQEVGAERRASGCSNMHSPPNPPPKPPPSPHMKRLRMGGLARRGLVDWYSTM